MKSKLTLAALSMAVALMASAQTSLPVYLNPDAPVEVRVQDALKRLTVHEKVKLMLKACSPRLACQGWALGS